MVNYEIWDGESGNLLVTRPTQIEALGIVRDAIARFGDQYAEALALLRTDEHGESQLIAEGAALAAMSRVAPVSFPDVETKRAV